MARLSGKDGAVLIAAVLVAALRRWEYEETDVSVDSTAAGDDWDSEVSLRGTFEFNFEALLEIATPFVFPNTIRGTAVAFVGKVDDAHTNGLISGTGRCSRLRVTSPYDGMIMIAGTLRSHGTAPVWDMSPAT